jgi:hypothetical protein
MGKLWQAAHVTETLRHVFIELPQTSTLSCTVRLIYVSKCLLQVQNGEICANTKLPVENTHITNNAHQLRSHVKVMILFFAMERIVHSEFDPQGQTVNNSAFYQ